MIKLVLADLDGTVVRPGSNSASQPIVDAVRAGEVKGVVFCAVTGRPFVMAQELLHALDFRGPCIVEGGASIVDAATGERLWAKYMPAQTIRDVVQMLVPHAYAIGYGKGNLPPEQVDINTIQDDDLGVWASVPADQADAIVAELRNLPDIAVHANHAPAGDASRCGVQVTHVLADKQHAVAELLNMLDIDKAHTLAIGDGDNDIPLFNAAQIKVAMGNASPGLRAAADHVVSSVQDDGFAEAIRTFVL